jgi:release factor glutamine methyltransferase
MNVSQCLIRGQAMGLQRLEAQILFLHAIGRPLHDRAWLLAHDTDGVTPEQLANFEAFAERRLQHEPVAYIVGQKEFFGLTLQIDKRVLDPRDDTEVLVEWALACAASLAIPRFLDLGTGSGAIALALQSQRPAAKVMAVDASSQALSLASHNAKHLGLEVSFLESNWLNQVQGEFDVIVSNPPYIEANDPHLALLKHEPQEALVSGSEGLQDIQTIVENAHKNLAQGGWLLIEHGWQQSAQVRALLQAAGYGHVQSKLDLAGIERCSGGQK